MKYFLLIITCLVAVLQIENLEEQPVNIKAWAILVVLIISTIVSFLIEYKQSAKEEAKEKEEKYKKNEGVISADLKGRKIEYPGLKVGKTVFVYTGSDYGGPFWGLDLELWLENGKVLLSTTIRSDNGNVIAIIKANEWMVNTNNRLDRNFDDNAIEVKDMDGNIVLQAFFDGEHINFAGVVSVKPECKATEGSEGFTSDGFIFEHGNNDQEGAVIRNFYKGEKVTTNIKPIFAYPSGLHPGERVS